MTAMRRRLIGPITAIVERDRDRRAETIAKRGTKPE
jgi:hypothetical protein